MIKILNNGVVVNYPSKLAWRMDEILELVERLKMDNQRIVKVKVWETKRHDLCYAEYVDGSDTNEV